MKSLEKQIFQHISLSRTRVTFCHLQKRFFRLTPQALKAAVANLMRCGHLGYTYEFGNSYLAISVNRPILVSEHVLLTPPNTSFEAVPGQAVVLLERGGAFGLGEHPTTRLAIQLLDRQLRCNPWRRENASLSAVDIGTGSGVLAIVAAKLGIDHVIAVDTDPCAVFEARANVRLNGLEDRITVVQKDENITEKKFDLVMANLRTPTLVTLLSQIEKITARNSRLIFSGIQLEELHQIRNLYDQSGFQMVKTCSEKNWCALSLARGEI